MMPLLRVTLYTNTACFPLKHDDCSGINRVRLLKPVLLVRDFGPVISATAASGSMPANPVISVV